MKFVRHLLPFLALLAGLLSVTLVPAAESKKKDQPAESFVPAKGKLIPAKDVDPAWLANARKNYPLKVCLSSDEKFGDPADIAAFVYRESGKPDRLVLFCCEGCSEDFMKETAKDLAKLDAAQKKAAAKKR